MFIKSISEIIYETDKMEQDEQKILHLKKYKSPALRFILDLIYNPKYELLLPKKQYVWKRNRADIYDKLYRDYNDLRLFFAGFGYDVLTDKRREILFISMLENIQEEDAEFIQKHIILKVPIKGISVDLIQRVYPGMIENV